MFYHWAEAPGSCMLFGEHAVLEGYPAIVSALDISLRVGVKRRADGRLSLRALGLAKDLPWQERACLADEFAFLEACISAFPEASSGLDLRVESEIDPKRGFGSSAALIAASLLAISQALAPNCPKTENWLFEKGLALLQKVQGFGSGADLAASIYGGCLEYRIGQIPRSIRPPCSSLFLTYSGHKTSSGKVLSYLAEKKRRGTLDLDAIEQLGRISLEALAAWPITEDRTLLAQLCERHQEAMQRLDLIDPALEKLCHLFKKEGIVHKISGAGLGDCLLSWDSPYLFKELFSVDSRSLACRQTGVTRSRPPK